MANWTQPRHASLRATNQWQLEGASPRYLALVPGQPSEVATGQIDNPTVTLSCTAADWVRIAAGRLSQTSALLTRRLRITGD